MIHQQNQKTDRPDLDLDGFHRQLAPEPYRAPTSGLSQLGTYDEIKSIVQKAIDKGLIVPPPPPAPDGRRRSAPVDGLAVDGELTDEGRDALADGAGSDLPPKALEKIKALLHARFPMDGGNGHE